MKRTLIHSRKVMWVMRDFINEISDLTVLDIPTYPISWEEWKNLPRKKRMCKLTKGEEFSCCPGDDSCISIRYNLEQRSVSFRKNFESFCPSARGFANVTIYLLHELGHCYTEDDVEEVEPEYDREEALMMGQFLCSTKEEWNDWYYNFMVDEKLATEWAINWLSDPEHRKIAKAFEKKFFACFA